MPLEGSIKDFGLSDIFQLIYVQQKSGIMSISNRTRRAAVGFVKGMVVSAQVDNAERAERIGEVLVRAKRITQRQLDAALKAQQDSGEYLGQVLVSQGVVSPEDLKRALRLQILEAVYGLFRWKEGQYSFEQREVAFPKDYIEPISTEHILMEGIRRLDEWPYIEKKVPSLHLIFEQVPDKRGEIEQAPRPAAKEAPQTSDDPLADLDIEQEGRFSADEIAVYYAVNGTNDVSRIIELLQMGEFDVCKALANLQTAGLIVPISAPAAASEAREPSVVYQAFRARVATSLQWSVNVALVVVLTAAPAWWLWSVRDRMVGLMEEDLQAARTLLVPNHLKGLRQLVRVWEVEHGRLPNTLFEPLAAYGAGTWPRNDPWGNPWGYDPANGAVFVQDERPSIHR